MTTLAITPNWKNKSAKFKGTVAAGEHVSVTIQNDDGEGGEFIADASTLRLRVVNPCNGRTLAIFPEPVPEGETPETWDSDLSPLRCTLNLNTVQMLKAVPPAVNVPLLWVLDDYDNNTLYFKEQFPVEHWPRLRGEEEPTDLDNYKDIIADFNTRLDGYDTRITGAENAAQAATENASTANDTADEAKTIASEAVDVAQQAKEAAETSQESAAASATAAQNAAAAAIAAAESINSPDATLTEEGVAADAKATGERIAAERIRAETAEATEKARAEGVESGLDTRLAAAEKAINDEAQLRAAADADLEANKADKTTVAAISADVAAAQAAIVTKADKATTYTKTEVDTKIAGVQTFQKYLVQTLPAPKAADMKGLYFVPTGETTEKGDLCEEWTVVEENGEKRWEKIGAKAVNLTLDNVVTRTSGNGVKSLGIWSAIWGALSALPTGFTSLYDWCVSQLAGKASTADATLTPIYSGTPTFSEWTFAFTPNTFPPEHEVDVVFEPGGDEVPSRWELHIDGGLIGGALAGNGNEIELVFTDIIITDFDGTVTATRTRTDILGYQLGSQTDRPLASEAEAEALRTGKQNALSDAQLDNIAAVTNKANDADVVHKSGDTMTGPLIVKFSSTTGSNNIAIASADNQMLAGFSFANNGDILIRARTSISIPPRFTPTILPCTIGGTLALAAPNPTAGNLAALDASGNPTDSEIPAANVALKTAIPYALGDPILIESESVQTDTTDPDNPITYAEVTLANRTANIVQIYVAIDELRVTLPAATDDKMRDFELEVGVGDGTAALAAPALSIYPAEDEDIALANPDGAIPELADGTATLDGSTVLYFTEFVPYAFLVKGEQLKWI